MNDARHYPNREAAVSARIDEIMDTFDFRKVADYMKAAGWEWKDDGVPDEAVIRRQARADLRRAAEQKMGAASGGFIILYRDGVDEHTFTPFFVLDLVFSLEETLGDDGVSYGGPI